jgi:hypothetical protein
MELCLIKPSGSIGAPTYIRHGTLYLRVKLLDDKMIGFSYYVGIDKRIKGEYHTPASFYISLVAAIYHDSDEVLCFF